MVEWRYVVKNEINDGIGNETTYIYSEYQEMARFEDLRLSDDSIVTIEWDMTPDRSLIANNSDNSYG